MPTPNELSTLDDLWLREFPEERSEMHRVCTTLPTLVELTNTRFDLTARLTHADITARVASMSLSRVREDIRDRLKGKDPASRAALEDRTPGASVEELQRSIERLEGDLAEASARSWPVHRAHEFRSRRLVPYPVAATLLVSRPRQAIEIGARRVAQTTEDFRELSAWFAAATKLGRGQAKTPELRQLQAVREVVAEGCSSVNTAARSHSEQLERFVIAAQDVVLDTSAFAAKHNQSELMEQWISQNARALRLDGSTVPTLLDTAGIAG